MDKDIAIEFKNVCKTYKLYKNDKQRFKAIELYVQYGFYNATR